MEIDTLNDSKYEGTHLKRDVRDWNNQGRANESGGMFGDFIEMNYQEMGRNGRQVAISAHEKLHSRSINAREDIF